MVFIVLAALQLGPKRSPELQDKFVLCQVPCYTEGEDSLRRTIDSLAALNYDDKRKLIFIICDGNIIGSGNDRTTPRIVLDILGIDPKLDPEPLLFKSVGEGSKALNYGNCRRFFVRHATPGQDAGAERNSDIRGQPRDLLMAVGSAGALG